MILKFGGHAMAAGLTLRAAAYEPFATAFDQAVRTLSGRQSFEPVIDTDGSLEAAYANADIALLLQRQVWGSGFPAPVFRDVFTVRRQHLLKDKHLKLRLERDDRQQFDAIWFNHAETLPERIEAAYRLERNVWNGTVSVQLMLEWAGAV